MEPSVETKPKAVTRKGRGSLENPEVYENVPGHVIPILEREFDDFDTESRKGHITTRQNFQFHHIPLPDAAKAIRMISDAGLSSREACGNTVRNVTGDPWAGVSADEAFDPTPYVGAFVRYFVRNEVCQLLPRKFKVAFTADDADVAITKIHDLGFLPRIREIDGKQVKGFEIRTGGGTSIMARVGGTFWDFATVDDGEYLKVSEAVLRIFDRQEDLRANRARARIKFLIDRVGIDEFRRMVDEELKGDWVNERDFDPSELLFVDDEWAHAPDPPLNPSSPNGDSRAFDSFVASNVRPQKQEGFSTVEVKVTRGDLTPEQMRGLADLMRDFTGGYARTSVQQNLVLRWVRNESLYDVWLRLDQLELADAGAHQITDVVSCPGTDSCKLGITSSMGLNTAVQARLEEMQIEDELTRQIHVKMSGCPNGCSQHHVANIGFYGAAMKVGGHQLPAYIPHLGGNYEGGDVVMGHRLKSRIPAKRVPDAVERWVRHYESNRQDGEQFNDFVERVGTEQFEGLVKDLSMPVEFGPEHITHFIDWNRKELYQVVRGEGECAV
jgi:sulfite reductase beta subunit-like hemoprotein